MKAISALAPIAMGVLSISSIALWASEADARIELAFNKPPAFPPHIRYDTTKAEETYAQFDERTGFRFKEGIGDLLEPRVKPVTVLQQVTPYALKIDLQKPKPNNVFQPEKSPGIECSGILVQALRNNPLQLFNPLTPAEYGDGEANTFRDFITGQPEGLKVLSIRF